MNMFSSLPVRLLLAVILGLASGSGLGGPLSETWPAGSAGIMHVIEAFKYVIDQLIGFVVPLIIIGFIAPSVTRLGRGASRMLTAALALAYCSSLGAALFSAGAGYAIIPHLSIATNPEGLRELPELLFKLDIPQIFPVMSALVLAVLVGLAAAWTKADVIGAALNEFQNIVTEIVTRVIIPLLPVFIALTFCALAYEGAIVRQLPVFLQVIGLVLLGQVIWLVVLYSAAGLYSGRNPLDVLRFYGPAWLTAVGTMSSAATLPVALACARRSPVLRRDMVDFGVPLFANIHLCGSVLTEVFFCLTISLMLYGSMPSPGTIILFCLLLGIFAIGAPGVPGGTVMDAHDICPAGQLRHGLQCDRRRRIDPDADRIRGERGACVARGDVTAFRFAVSSFPAQGEARTCAFCGRWWNRPRRELSPFCGCWDKGAPP